MDQVFFGWGKEQTFITDTGHSRWCFSSPTWGQISANYSSVYIYCVYAIWYNVYSTRLYILYWQGFLFSCKTWQIFSSWSRMKSLVSFPSWNINIASNRSHWLYINARVLLSVHCQIWLFAVLHTMPFTGIPVTILCIPVPALFPSSL